MTNKLLILLAVVFGLVSCDEGDILPKENFTSKKGFSVRLSGNVSGYDDWQNSDGYSLVLAGFGDPTGSMDYAVISKNIQAPDADGNIDIVMSGIPEGDVKTLEICVVNRLRVKLASFFVRELTATETDTCEISAGDVDVSMRRMVQNEVFSPTCASCHGASGKGARGLFLTDNDNFNPVSKPSGAVSGSLVVEPGNHLNSVLYRALIDNAGGALHQPHADMLEAKRRDDLLKIVELWIDNVD